MCRILLIVMAKVEEGGLEDSTYTVGGEKSLRWMRGKQRGNRGGGEEIIN